MKKIAAEVAEQENRAGKLLVSLDEMVEKVPAQIEKSVARSIEGKITAVQIQLDGFAGKFNRSLHETVEAASLQTRKAFTSAANQLHGSANIIEKAAGALCTAKDRVGWRSLVMNLVASTLGVTCFFSVANGRFPWQMHGPTPREQQLIMVGEEVSKRWTRIPKDVKDAIEARLQ